MSLDTIEGIMAGRQESRHYAYNNLEGAMGGNNRYGAYAFPDDDLGTAIPASVAGEFPTSYAGYPALAAPARVIEFTGHAISTNRPQHALLDRLWHSGAITGTGGTVDSGDMPARSNNGDGYSLFIGIRNTATRPDSTMSGTVTYTNSQGVSGRTATILDYSMTILVNGLMPVGLDVGDTGVRSVQSVACGDIGAGNLIQLVVARRVVRENTVGLHRSAAPIDAKAPGRFLACVTEILPIGTVLTPTGHWSSGSANTHLAYTLAYG